MIRKVIMKTAGHTPDISDTSHGKVMKVKHLVTLTSSTTGSNFLETGY